MTADEKIAKRTLECAAERRNPRLVVEARVGQRGVLVKRAAGRKRRHGWIWRALARATCWRTPKGRWRNVLGVLPALTRPSRPSAARERRGQDALRLRPGPHPSRGFSSVLFERNEKHSVALEGESVASRGRRRGESDQHPEVEPGAGVVLADREAFIVAACKESQFHDFKNGKRTMRRRELASAGACAPGVPRGLRVGCGPALRSTPSRVRQLSSVVGASAAARSSRSAH